MREIVSLPGRLERKTTSERKQPIPRESAKPLKPLPPALLQRQALSTCQRRQSVTCPEALPEPMIVCLLRLMKETASDAFRLASSWWNGFLLLAHCSWAAPGPHLNFNAVTQVCGKMTVALHTSQGLRIWPFIRLPAGQFREAVWMHPATLGPCV